MPSSDHHVYHHLPPGFLSLLIKTGAPSLNCLQRRRYLTIHGHEEPRWQMRFSLHLLLGLPCRLVHSRSVRSRSVRSVESVVFQSCIVSGHHHSCPSTRSRVH